MCGVVVGVTILVIPAVVIYKLTYGRKKPNTGMYVYDYTYVRTYVDIRTYIYLHT